MCVYPAYLNKTLSLEGGRKVSKALAVDNPTAREIAVACHTLKFSAVLEVLIVILEGFIG